MQSLEDMMLKQQCHGLQHPATRLGSASQGDFAADEEDEELACSSFASASSKARNPQQRLQSAALRPGFGKHTGAYFWQDTHGKCALVA